MQNKMLEGFIFSLKKFIQSHHSFLIVLLISLFASNPISTKVYTYLRSKTLILCTSYAKTLTLLSQITLAYIKTDVEMGGLT